MSQHTTFEVHAQKNGQWTIHETYKGHQREEALEDAKTLLSNSSHIEGVKVVKETLDADSGIFNDSVIFKAEASQKPISKKGPARRGGASGRGRDIEDDWDSDEDRKRGSGKQKKKGLS